MEQPRIVIIGGGVGGTLTANLLRRKLKPAEASITVIDGTGKHIYQPGWLYVPFGWGKPENLVRSERSLLSRNIALVIGEASRIVREEQHVLMADGRKLPYDYLVIASGARLAPEAVPGFAEGAYHFYNAEAALALRHALYAFKGGRIVVGVADIPYKCPPAPLEFTFLLDYYLNLTGRRKDTEIVYLSPINRVFTIESVSEFVTPMLAERGVETRTFFNTDHIDPQGRIIESLEGDTIQYDLLVMVPPHRGARIVVDSGLGDQQGWLSVDRETLETKDIPRIFGLGDATDLPVSKSGSAAHFEAKVAAERITAAVRGEIADEKNGRYDGHVMCFLETGYDQASQLVFDYHHPPDPPRPSRIYHYEKMAFNQAYWYLVPKGLV